MATIGLKKSMEYERKKAPNKIRSPRSSRIFCLRPRATRKWK